MVSRSNSKYGLSVTLTLHAVLGDPRSAHSMTESRMPSGVREWIEERVTERMGVQSIYEHITISEATIEKVRYSVLSPTNLFPRNCHNMKRGKQLSASDLSGL